MTDAALTRLTYEHQRVLRIQRAIERLKAEAARHDPDADDGHEGR